MNQEQDFETRKAGLNAKCEQVVQYAKELGLNCFAMAVVHNGAGGAVVSLESVNMSDLDALENTSKKVVNEIQKHQLKLVMEAASEFIQKMEEGEDEL